MISAVTIASAIAAAEKTNWVVAIALTLPAVLGLKTIAIAMSKAMRTPTVISPYGVSLNTFSPQSFTLGVAKKDIKKPPSLSWRKETIFASLRRYYPVQVLRV